MNELKNRQALNDAKNFCHGSAMAINSERAKNASFQNHLNLLIANSKKDSSFNKLIFNQLAEFTAKETKRMVLNDGDDLQDTNSVGWFMGILCYTWRNSLPVCNEKFDEIFLESWQYYFGVLLNASQEGIASNKTLTFYSSCHDRYEGGQLAQEAEVARKIIVQELTNKDIIVTIEPTLTNKKASFVKSKKAHTPSLFNSLLMGITKTEELGREGSINYFYVGEDTDFEFIVQKNNDSITQFVLKRLDKNLMLVYRE